MPKSSKKKKNKVADFSKAKLKLGKGKTLAANVVDTSFKARSIVLPSQSIFSANGTTEPSTRRQLTFLDLISQLKHHNTGVRKESILGLRELFDSHWEILELYLTPLVNALVRVIGDEDSGVRRQLLLFISWLFPKIKTDLLIPHSSLLLLFTTSAQTHIFPEIRIDAVRFLDVLLECLPASVTSGWIESFEQHGSRVLNGYLGILNAGTKYGEHGSLNATSTSSVVLTLTSKLVVLQSLSTFLQYAFASVDNSTVDKKNNSLNGALHAIFLKSSFPSEAAFYSLERLLEPACEIGILDRKWQPKVVEEDQFVRCYPLLNDANSELWTLQDLRPMTDEQDNSKQSHAGIVAQLASSLHSTIIETYLDCAPSVFSPGSKPTETEIQLVATVSKITRSLYHFIAHTSEHVEQAHISQLESIVNYMTPHFPALKADGKFDQLYEEFNNIFCELITLVMDVSLSDRSLKAFRTRKSKMVSSIHMNKVTRYVVSRLGGEKALSGTISPTAYRALLPTIWSLINSANGIGVEVIHATLDHATKLSSKSICKPLTVEFVGRIMLLSVDPHYQGEFCYEKDPEIRAKFEVWLLHLPQVLWELGSTNLSTTETILKVLLRMMQRLPRAAQLESEILGSLQSRLVPYLYIEHATRGALDGPYKKLPVLANSRLRLLFLDLTSTILASRRCSGEETEMLCTAVEKAIAGEKEEKSYWNHLQECMLI